MYLIALEVALIILHAFFIFGYQRKLQEAKDAARIDVILEVYRIVNTKFDQGGQITTRQLCKTLLAKINAEHSTIDLPANK